jgi:hydrogenase expression/formation protein HypD
MNVCGGHERTITQAGIRSLLPDYIELIPGPGCPVCICPEEDVYQAIQMALHYDITLLTFGDMLRVPVNVAPSQPRSLEQAAAMGADIRPIASPTEALQMARQQPERQFIFFAAGFETTMAPVAALLDQGIPDKLLLLLSGRRTWPAVAALLTSGAATFDGLIAPGHVATIMGADEWQFIVTEHHLPCAVAGFTADSLLAALYSVLRQRLEQHYFIDNCYPALVTAQGNPSARQCLERQFECVTANWRGLGAIAASGYSLRADLQDHDARLMFTLDDNDTRKRAGAMPPGCDCARVVCGQIYPDQCRLYQTACTPLTPVGPCMVSDEGACRIWWSGGQHRRTGTAVTPTPAP